jgi:hypothetical protein
LAQARGLDSDLRELFAELEAARRAGAGAGTDPPTQRLLAAISDRGWEIAEQKQRLLGLIERLNDTRREP